MTIGSLFAALGCPSLPGAKCRGRSHLFDEPEQGEPAAVVEQRHRQALLLCRICPSLEQCGDWFDNLSPQKRPGGVVAGRIHNRLNRKESA